MDYPRQPVGRERESSLGAHLKMDIVGDSVQQAAAFSFELLSATLDCLNSREVKEQLLQYNLDSSLDVLRFRLLGQVTGLSVEEYMDVLRDFFASPAVLAALETNGEPVLPVEVRAKPLGLDVTNMDFFDRLTELDIVGPGGKIRGCFDESFDGIVVGDLLREFLLNEDSENSSAFSESEKNEFIFQLLRLFAVGGSLCQPDTGIERYLSITKAFYKDLVTVYKDAKTGAVKVSGRVFLVESVAGLDLYKENPNSPHNRFFAVVDPIKKTITMLRMNFKNFW